MYRNTIFSTTYNIGKLILFYGAILDLYRKILVVLGVE
jgi:hypothetical protein